MNWVVCGIISVFKSLGNFVGRIVPDLDKSLGFFFSGNITSLVLLVDLVNKSVCLSKNILFLLRYLSVAYSNGNS